MEVEDAGFKVGGVDWTRPKVAKRAKVVKRIMMTFMLAFQFPTEGNIHTTSVYSNKIHNCFPRTDH